MKKLLAAVTVLAVSTAQADTIFVDDDAPLGGDGMSWNGAYRYLQDALADAEASGGVVDEIRVGQGSYRPDLDEAGNVTPLDTFATFRLVGGVMVAGGYAGLGQADPGARDIALYETTLTGDLDGDGTTDGGNSRHIVTAEDAPGQRTINGFTITLGRAGNDGGGALLHELIRNSEARPASVSNAKRQVNRLEVDLLRASSASEQIACMCWPLVG